MRRSKLAAFVLVATGLVSTDHAVADDGPPCNFGFAAGTDFTLRQDGADVILSLHVVGSREDYLEQWVWVVRRWVAGTCSIAAAQAFPASLAIRSGVELGCKPDCYRTASDCRRAPENCVDCNADGVPECWGTCGDTSFHDYVLRDSCVPPGAVVYELSADWYTYDGDEIAHSIEVTASGGCAVDAGVAVDGGMEYDCPATPPDAGPSATPPDAGVPDEGGGEGSISPAREFGCAGCGVASMPRALTAGVLAAVGAIALWASRRRRRRPPPGKRPA